MGGTKMGGTGAKFLVAFNRTRGKVVASRIRLADTPATRAKGLLGRASLEPGEGLWIAPCAMIHTCFMRFAIDVLFLDSWLKVRRVQERMAPWRLSPWVFSARSVLELAAGTLQGTVKPGDELEFRPYDASP